MACSALLCGAIGFASLQSPDPSSVEPEVTEAAAPVESAEAPPPSPGLPDSAWSALLQSEVELSRADGFSVRGRLTAVDATTITIITDTGAVSSIPRAEISSVRAIVPPAATPPAAAPEPAAKVIGRDWAGAGTATGLSMVGVGVVLGIGSEITVEDQIPALPMGGVATMMFAAGIPIIAGGGSSARRAAGVRGSLGARIGGWVTYGLTMTNAVVLIGLGAAEVEVQHGQVAAVVVLGATSGALMAADALKSRRQAAVERRKMTSALRRRGLSLAPRVLRSRGETHGGVLSLSGRF